MYNFFNKFYVLSMIESMENNLDFINKEDHNTYLLLKIVHINQTYSSAIKYVMHSDKYSDKERKQYIVSCNANKLIDLQDLLKNDSYKYVCKYMLDMLNRNIVKTTNKIKKFSKMLEY